MLRSEEPNYGDWLSVAADTPKDVLSTAYFAYSALLMSQIADTLGKFEDGGKYALLFEQIKDAFNAEYVSDDGRIKGDTQAVYVLAIRFGLVDGDRREQAAQRLIERIEAKNWHLSTGFIGTKDLMTTLNEIGREDVAWRLIMNDAYPSWGFSIKHGATSIWERWNGWTPEEGFADPRMNSFAHYSFGAVGEWMFKTIGGIDSAAPAFKRIVIRPVPGGGVIWTKTRYDSIHGRIATDWKLENGAMALNVEIPANTTATVHLPAASPERVTESGKLLDKAEGVSEAEKVGDEVVCQIGSGRYSFRTLVQ